ncbi:hypothetical protein ACHAWX_004461 [Stephanocyclus meneghinianus]
MTDHNSTTILRAHLRRKRKSALLHLFYIARRRRCVHRSNNVPAHTQRRQSWEAADGIMFPRSGPPPEDGGPLPWRGSATPQSVRLGSVLFPP